MESQKEIRAGVGNELRLFIAPTTVAGLAHNPGEFIGLDYLPTRIVLVAGLVMRNISGNGTGENRKMQRKRVLEYHLAVVTTSFAYLTR